MAFPFIKFGENLQCFVQIYYVHVPFGRGDHDPFGRNFLCATAALIKSLHARAINQQVSHHSGRNGKKMCAVLPIALSFINQFQIGFINEFVRLNGNLRTLAP